MITLISQHILTILIQLTTLKLGFLLYMFSFCKIQALVVRTWVTPYFSILPRNVDASDTEIARNGRSTTIGFLNLIVVTIDAELSFSTIVRSE